MYINLLYIPLFSFAYLVFLFFSSFPLKICQFYFHCFIPPLVPCFHFVLQFVLYLVVFLTGRQTFWFPLFTRSVCCTLFLLDCFDFAYRCICISVYSVTFFIFVLNICLYVGLLQFCGVFLFLFSFFCIFFYYYFLFFKILFIFLNLLLFFYLYSFICLFYCSFPLAVNL